MVVKEGLCDAIVVVSSTNGHKMKMSAKTFNGRGVL